MAELREYVASEIEDYDDARLELSEEGQVSCTKLYIKSEADKVIAELEERFADGDKDFEMANHQNERLLKIVRHHKCKRCLAMAMRCGDACDKWMMKKATAIELGKDGVEYYHQARRKLWYYMRWQKRWLELSEKFKEGV